MENGVKFCKIAITNYLFKCLSWVVFSVCKWKSNVSFSNMLFNPAITNSKNYKWLIRKTLLGLKVE